ncbi:MAG: 3-hydroxyacyl-CoA dehydrogenase family protein [Chryseolinea sp.]
MEPKIEIGVVGLGLMGCSITTCLLMAGHDVVAVAPIPVDMLHATKRVTDHLTRSLEEGLVKHEAPYYLQHLVVTENYDDLRKCRLVIECTLEDPAIKKVVYAKIEDSIDKDALLTSNTSAIPISILQTYTKHPHRFFGLHWAEPSHTTRFLEVICGDKSDVAKGEFLRDLSEGWGKEPTLVRKDIRGFITNRLMYAMYREAFYLVENGFATVEDVDRACRNNAGYWMTLAGVFRWMDLTGVPAYYAVMKDLFPTLCNSTEVPKMIEDIVKAGGKGVANGIGFHSYGPGEAEAWEETFKDFSYEIRDLALRYPADVVKKKLEQRSADAKAS